MNGKRIVDISEYRLRVNSESFFRILDKCVSATSSRGKRAYATMIAIGPEDEHFCWFHYRAGRNNVDCIVEPAIPSSRLREVKELLSQAGIKWKDLHRSRSDSRTIDIHLNAEQVSQKEVWGQVEKVLRISAASA